MSSQDKRNHTVSSVCTRSNRHHLYYVATTALILISLLSTSSAVQARQTSSLWKNFTLHFRGGEAPFAGRKSVAAVVESKDRGLVGDVTTTMVKTSAQNAIQSATGKRKSNVGPTLKEAFFYGLAVIAVGVSAVAMVFETSMIVDVVGAICMFLGPSAAFLQKKLSDIESLRAVTNEMRNEVNTLSEQNIRLSSDNTRLEQSINKLKKAEGALEEIGKAQGMNIDTLIKQVNEYKEIQQQENLNAKVQQNLLSVIMRSDSDQDFQIDPEEVDVLVLRLSNIPGV